MGIAEHIKQEERTCKTFDISLRKQEDYYLPDGTIPQELGKDREDFLNTVKESHSKIGMDTFPEQMFNALVWGSLMNGKYRDACLLICQANWGMRFGDAISVHVADISDEEGKIADKFYLCEQKTAHTRKTKQTRCFYNNEAVKKALKIMLDNPKHNKKMWYDYLFVSESNNAPKILENGRHIQKPLSRTQAETIIKSGVEKYVINPDDSLKLNTHSLRKMYGNLGTKKVTELKNIGKIEADEDALKFMQTDFGHSSMEITKRYIEQMEQTKSTVCKDLNIGLAVLNKFLEGNYGN